jgi:hypothetical protein
MKRDMDLIRLILLAIEESPGDLRMPDGPYVWASKITVEGRGAEEIRDHLPIIEFLDLIKQVDMSTASRVDSLVRLTNKGHDFVALTRDKARWKDVTGVVVEITGGLHFEVLTAVIRKRAIEALFAGGAIGGSSREELIAELEKAGGVIP